MSIDITKAILANPLKNGTMLVQCKVTGFSDRDIYNRYVINTPVIGDIENKYTDRFDDPTYYSGGGGADGGDVGEGDVLGV